MPIPTPDTCWQAVLENDSSYDGLFVVAVKTTGIYCRPACSARTPKRENVEFLDTPTKAEKAGYRACKRCHPKEHQAKDERAERVQIICDYIDTHLDETLTLEALSEIAYWSPFHLQRSFKQVMGITPRQYAEAQRIVCFKERLKAGASVTNAALDAGYSSSSRVYEHSTARLGMTPTLYQQGGDDVTIAYSIAESPLGQLLVAMTERGVCALDMGENDDFLLERLKKEFPAAYIFRDDEYLQAAIQTIIDYLSGWQPHIELPLDIRVTAFQQRVLDELQHIPYGETRSYGEIAVAIGQPKAARAVGGACNKNPVPLIIPCHRVIGADGKLVGYGLGIERKVKLLDMEQSGQK